MDENKLPVLIAGPILRRSLPGQIIIWWISKVQLKGRLTLFTDQGDQPLFSIPVNNSNTKVVKFGKYAYVHLLDVQLNPELPVNEKIEYDFTFNLKNKTITLADLLPGLVYPEEKRPFFIIKNRIERLLHGSCRNPHHPSDDSMVAVDREIMNAIGDTDKMPALLMLTGDQIYADDVAGPMLHAIHQTIRLLGLYDEIFEDSALRSCCTLYSSPDTYYGREKILPSTKVGKRWFNRGGRHPVFTSFFAHNHLITFAEFMAMYILVWSKCMWELIEFNSEAVQPSFRAEYENQKIEIEKFIAALPAVQRVFAHIPTYMIFDDHDITDDWNLTAQWEKAAYSNLFSRRIIGNGLMAYWLCQGWGNAPENFEPLFSGPGSLYCNHPSRENHDALINVLLEFRQWHYDLPTNPKMIVIDSRTRRWRSKKRLSNPSGLLDRNGLNELQQGMMDEKAVIIVAPAPIFGVKIIEMIQNIFSFFGYPLLVDAENWMAHKGTAYQLLQIFKNMRTPDNFIILSGDVHYSFGYDVVLRFKDNSPHIWQITSSGIKNEFPGKILKWLDRLNRWLYAPYSPLNIFTKRRDMKIRNRIPVGKGLDRLVNTSGIGLVQINDRGEPLKIFELYANSRRLEFISKKESLSA